MNSAEIKTMVFLLKHVDQFDDGARQLNARRAAADDNEVEMTLTLVIVGLIHSCRSFKFMNEMAAQRDRLLEALHRIGVLCDALVAEEIRRCARREYEVIVRDLTVIGQEYLAFLIDPLRRGKLELHILVVLEECARRICNFRHGEHSGRYLIEERLKKMIVVPIDKRDADIFFCEFLGETNPSKTGADNNNVLLLRHDIPLSLT